MKNETKIKIAIVTKDLGRNGISAVIMNYAENMDLNKFKLTIFAGEKIDDSYLSECQKFGIDVIKLSNKKRKFKYYNDLYKNIHKREYDILHVHGNSSAMFFELFIGKLKKIKVRIAHCHNTKKSKSILKKFLLLFFNHSYTNAFACGKLAGDILYKNKEFYIMKNGVDTSKYLYDESTRNKIRKQLNIDEKFVLGHIGRFNTQKNHQFLLDVFERVAEKDNKFVLLLVGDGPDFNEIQERISKSKYKDRIILYGETSKPEEMYLAMDAFVFPSLYEGLPLTLVEAQISGLQCLISDIITDEVIISDIVTKLPLNNIEIWVKEVLKLNLKDDRNMFYSKNKSGVENYDIKKSVQDLEEKYIDIIKQNKN